MHAVKRPTFAGSESSTKASADRSILKALAYRLLGSFADAEDAVQETYLRWYRLDHAEHERIMTPIAWQKTALTRICLDMLRSARRKREVYIGEWLPEPVPENAMFATGNCVTELADPADHFAMANSVSMGLMVVLEKMTPAERVSFILHDVFQYSFDEIGEIVGRTSQACRQLAFLARRRIGEERLARPSREEHERVNAAFKEAWTTGNIAALVAVLDDKARAVTDGGGRVSAAIEPMQGPGVIADFFMSAFTRQRNLKIYEAIVNGDPGFIGKGPCGIVAVISTWIGNGRLSDIWVMRNPDKLRLWQ